MSEVCGFGTATRDAASSIVIDLPADSLSCGFLLGGQRDSLAKP